MVAGIENANNPVITRDDGACFNASLSKMPQAPQQRSVTTTQIFKLVSDGMQLLDKFCSIDNVW